MLIKISKDKTEIYMEYEGLRIAKLCEFSIGHNLDERAENEALLDLCCNKERTHTGSISKHLREINKILCNHSGRLRAKGDDLDEKIYR
jgi:hypothetical protein